MLERTREGFGTMTEVADAIVRDTGLSFHQAYLLVGEMVAKVLERREKAGAISVPLLDEVAKESLGRPLNLSDEALQAALDPVAAVESRTVTGGPAPSEVLRMLNERLESQVRLQGELKNRRDELLRADEALNGAVDAVLSEEILP